MGWIYKDANGNYIDPDRFDISPNEATPEQKFNLEDVERWR